MTKSTLSFECTKRNTQKMVLSLSYRVSHQTIGYCLPCCLCNIGVYSRSRWAGQFKKACMSPLIYGLFARSLCYAEKIILGISPICLRLFFPHALISNENPHKSTDSCIFLEIMLNIRIYASVELELWSHKRGLYPA